MSDDVDDFLDWLCWTRAFTGERFYPPSDTAAECMDAFEEQYEHQPAERKQVHAKELGQHGRAHLEAVELFDDMESWGFDPVGRANRYLETTDSDLEPIDWSWLENSHYAGDIHDSAEVREP